MKIAYITNFKGAICNKKITSLALFPIQLHPLFLKDVHLVFLFKKKRWGGETLLCLGVGLISGPEKNFNKSPEESSQMQGIYHMEILQIRVFQCIFDYYLSHMYTVTV